MDNQWQGGSGTAFWVGFWLFVVGVGTVTAALTSSVNTYAVYLWLLATVLLLAGVIVMTIGLSTIYRWPKWTILTVISLLITSNGPIVLLASRPRGAPAVGVAILCGLLNFAFYISRLRNPSHSNADKS